MRICSAQLGAAAIVMVAATPANAAICTRLPLSDIAFSETAATTAAREKLEVYAAERLKKRGWSGKGKLRSSRERVDCEPYLNLGLIAAGYRCRVTATFCAPTPKSRKRALGRVIRLRLKGSTFEISGVLKKIDKGNYVIAPPNSDNITVTADKFDCLSKICP